MKMKSKKIELYTGRPNFIFLYFLTFAVELECLQQMKKCINYEMAKHNREKRKYYATTKKKV